LNNPGTYSYNFRKWNKRMQYKATQSHPHPTGRAASLQAKIWTQNLQYTQQVSFSFSCDNVSIFQLWNPSILWNYVQNALHSTRHTATIILVQIMPIKMSNQTSSKISPLGWNTV
jgi:hypothetical protein